MITFAKGNSGLIILLVIIILIILGVGFFLLYYFVLSRNKYKKQIDGLERKYSYLDALLIGQDSQYIHRLEIISRTNLLYVEKYNEFSRKFKTVFDSDDKFANQMIKQVKTLIANNQYKNIKIVIGDAKKAVDAFEENVNQLAKELYSLIRPEEESRHTILQLKENYRRVKQIFYANSSDLELVTTSFTQVFDKLDQSFSKFETHIEGGEYDEANALIPVIRNVVTALDSALEQLPNLCILVTSIIPEKIKELGEAYANVEKSGVPLFNLSFKHHENVWNLQLASIKDRLISLKLAGIKGELEKIQFEIDEIKSALDNEVTDRDEFNHKSDELYEKTIELEKTYVKICSILQEVKQVYVVSPAHEEEIAKLNDSINQLGVTKRTLDNYVHAGTKQPYSVLKNKLDELEHDYEVAAANINDFREYLNSLKSSSEDAYTLVFVYYYHCKQIESLLREIAIEDFSSLYTEQIENCYALLNELDQTLKLKPIDVDRVNELVEDLKNTANNFFDDVETKHREAQLAESAIVYGNRDRNHQADVHQRYSLLEKSFFEGNFAKVYHEANDLYRRMHAEENPDASKK